MQSAMPKGHDPPFPSPYPSMRTLPPLLKSSFALPTIPALYLGLHLTAHLDATATLALSVASREWEWTSNQSWVGDLWSLLIYWCAVSAFLRGCTPERRVTHWSFAIGRRPRARGSTQVEFNSNEKCGAEDALEIDTSYQAESEDKENVIPLDLVEQPLPAYRMNDSSPLLDLTLLNTPAPLMAYPVIGTGDDRFFLPTARLFAVLEPAAEDSEELAYRPSVRSRARSRRGCAVIRRLGSQSQQQQAAESTLLDVSILDSDGKYDPFVGQSDDGCYGSDDDDYALQALATLSPYNETYPSPCGIEELEIPTTRTAYYGDNLTPSCSPPNFSASLYHHYHAQRRLASAPQFKSIAHSSDPSKIATDWLTLKQSQKWNDLASDPGAHPSGLSWCSWEEEDEAELLALSVRGLYGDAAVERYLPTLPETSGPEADSTRGVSEQQPRQLVPPVLLVEGWPINVWWPSEMQLASEDELRIEFFARASCFMAYPDEIEASTM